MRIIARFEKKNGLKYTSHLDMQRTFHRAIIRAGLPAEYSQGFNPHIQLSFATALSVGTTSEAEWVDIGVTEHIEPAEFIQKMNAVLPEGIRILEAMTAEDNLPSLTALVCASEYSVIIHADAKEIINRQKKLLAGEIIVTKKSKSGEKTFDMRPQILEAHAFPSGEGIAELNITGELTSAGSMNVELYLSKLLEGMNGVWYGIHRKTLFSSDGRIMPKYEKQTADT